MKIAELPQGIKWKQIWAMGMIAGIGFTMSIFIDSLAFKDVDLVNLGKATILVTSTLAAVFGLLAMMITCKSRTNN